MNGCIVWIFDVCTAIGGNTIICSLSEVFLHPYTNTWGSLVTVSSGRMASNAHGLYLEVGMMATTAASKVILIVGCLNFLDWDWEWRVGPWAFVLLLRSDVASSWEHIECPIHWVACHRWGLLCSIPCLVCSQNHWRAWWYFNSRETSRPCCLREITL